MVKNEEYCRYISELKSIVTLETVIAGILANLDGELKIDPITFNDAIRDLSDSNASSRYNDVLKDIDFDDNGYYLHSRRLSAALFKLGCSEIIGVVNPKYGRYVVSREIIDNAREFLNRRFDEDSRAEFEKIAHAFMEFYQRRSETRP